MPGDSKTEKATPKKRQDERKKGNVFQSTDIILAVSILVIFYTLKLVFPLIYRTTKGFLLEMFSMISTTQEITTELCLQLFVRATTVLVITAGPIMLAAMIVGIIGSGVQTRFIFSFSSIKPKFSRISPGQGIKRLISLNAVFEILKSILKVTLIIYILYSSFMKIAQNFPKLMDIGVEAGIMFIFDSIMSMMIQIVMAFGVLAMFDFMYQWWSYENKMKMTKQEIKEEYKQAEGDPEVKGKIKQKQRAIATRRMMQEVPTADVIVRNPTHFAIAIRYNPEKDIAPVVVAKGQDYMAQKIIELANKYNIPMTENKPLARALYATVEPPAPIPNEFYSIMAEIMAWVYTLKNKDLKNI